MHVCRNATDAFQMLYIWRCISSDLSRDLGRVLAGLHQVILNSFCSQLGLVCTRVMSCIGSPHNGLHGSTCILSRVWARMA